MKTQFKQTGFTLMELMIVVTIIGIIASFAIPTLRDYMIDAKWGKAVANVYVLRTAINNCLSDNSGDAGRCDSLGTEELTRYGLTAFSPENEDLYRISLVTSTAAIKIEGKAPLADCVLTMTPSFSSASGMITWKYIMSSGSAVATAARCVDFVKGSTVG